VVVARRKNRKKIFRCSFFGFTRFLRFEQEGLFF